MSYLRYTVLTHSLMTHRHQQEKQRDKEEEIKGAWDTPRSLFCTLCYMFDCPTHSRHDVSTLSRTEPQRHHEDSSINSIPTSSAPCGSNCWRSSSSSGMSVVILIHSFIHLLCPSFRTIAAEDKPVKWSSVEVKIVQEAYVIYSNNYCKIARLLEAKTCRQVARYHKENPTQLWKPQYTPIKGKYNNTQIVTC